MSNSAHVHHKRRDQTARYRMTLHLINSAITRLKSLTSIGYVYCTVGEPFAHRAQVDRSFWDDHKGKRGEMGGCVSAFVSATWDKDAAMEHALLMNARWAHDFAAKGEFEQVEGLAMTCKQSVFRAVVVELRLGTTDRGADVQ